MLGQIICQLDFNYKDSNMYYIILPFAIVLLLVITPLALLFKLIRVGVSKHDKSWILRLLISLDQLGNVLGDNLLNSLLLKHVGSDAFGGEDETISSVVGKNYLKSNLTWLGIGLRNLLHYIDPDHCVLCIGE